MTSYKEAYKYPFIVTEILSSKNKLIEAALLSDINEDNNNILNLIKVLDSKEILNTTLPGYINKIISSHIDNESFYDNIFKNNNIIFEILLKYIYNDSYRDLFYLIVNESVKKGKTENYNFIQKILDNLLVNMNKYISLMNDNENLDNIIEIKDLIYNFIFILIKFAENNDVLFGLIIKKISENDLVRSLKSNLKEIDEEENEEENKIKNKNNINVFYCISKISILFSNLFNTILTKNEKDQYAFNKYYLSTVIDPPYSPYAYTPSYNTNKDNENKEEEDKDKNKENNVEADNNTNIKNENEESIKLLIDISINYLKDIYSIFENKIEIINELNKSIIFSFYNKITDILLLITVTEKKDDEKMNNFLNDILIDLIQLIIDYPFWAIIHNKTLKLFQFIIEFNFSIKKEKIINYLKNYFTDKKINELILDEGIILNNKKESDNNVYLINILNLLEKQDNQKIIEFLEKISKGLCEEEKMEPGEYVPKPDEDEIIFKKKEDYHDSEAFIFTPKKVIEDSKKIMKNLKQLDSLDV